MLFRNKMKNLEEFEGYNGHSLICPTELLLRRKFFKIEIASSIGL